MIESPTPRARLVLAALATLVVGGCGESVDPLAGKLENELRETTRRLDQTRAALGTAEQRIATLREEQTQDRHRLAELAASKTRLERELAGAHGELARRSRFETVLRQQRDQAVRRARDLGRERRALHASLASANAEIRRLQARQSLDQRRVAGAGHGGVAAARELDELRRYNGFLLQERGNLQAWLHEANATRRKQQNALEEARGEIARIKSEQSTADAASGELRAALAHAESELETAISSRDALAREIETLRVAATRAAQSERERNAYLEQTLAQTSAPGESHDRVAGESQKVEDADVAALRAELGEARHRVERLKIAKDYLVEKVEACTAQQQSSSAGGVTVARLDELLRVQIESEAARRAGGRFTKARWLTGSATGISSEPGFVRVATESDDAAKSTRHEKELAETKKKLADLELSNKTLTATLQELETECSAVRKQVETLTWANKKLVNELDAAYQSREAGIVGPLPDGTRGIYILRQGESLSRVAKAFYGDPGRWTDIVEANKEKIPDPDRVKAGTVIRIPE